MLIINCGDIDGKMLEHIHVTCLIFFLEFQWYNWMKQLIDLSNLGYVELQKVTCQI